MNPQIIGILWTVIVAVFAIVLILLAAVLWELLKTLKAVSSIAARIEMLTNIKGWLDILKFVGGKKKEKN